MKIIGLTGGIGTGKSTVTKILLSKGIPVVDADHISRSLLAPGSPYVVELVSLFGEWLLDENGNVDRKRLGERIFSSPELRGQLEKFLHPLIKEEIYRQIEEYGAQKVNLLILDIPLLFEGAYWQSQVDETWLVDTSEKNQLARIMVRDGLSEESAKKRIEAQMTLEEKRKLADVIIENNGTFEELGEKVNKLVLKNREKLEPPIDLSAPGMIL